MSPIARKAGTWDMMVYHFEADEDLEYLEENLQHLTVGILDMNLMRYLGVINTILHVSLDGSLGYSTEWPKPLCATMSTRRISLP